jgi:hypothetical protein
LLSLALGILSTSSRAQDLAMLERGSTTAPLEEPVIALSAPSAPISDDGNDDRSPVTGQLIIANNGTLDAVLTLDILNEQGHVVRHHVLDPSRGQRLWSVDVRSLGSGRYAARVLSAKGAVVNRFRRD